MKSFAIDLDGLLTVAAGVVDAEGALLEANAAFLRLLPPACVNPIGAGISQFFVQPAFAVLVAAAAGKPHDGYRGLMTIGDRTGKTRTLRGRAWQAGTSIRMLAEYDIDDLESRLGLLRDPGRKSAVAPHGRARSNGMLRRRVDQIEEALLTDALTGVGNRRRLDQELRLAIGRVRDIGGALSAIMADLDHFKGVNDEYGRDAGDKVLVEVGALLGSQSRSTDIVARVGGEAFVLLMQDTSLDRAMAKAETLRRALEAQLIDPLARPLTASFGVAELEREEGGESFLSRADAALYQAKEVGRNRVAAAHPVSACMR